MKRRMFWMLAGIVLAVLLLFSCREILWQFESKQAERAFKRKDNEHGIIHLQIARLISRVLLIDAHRYHDTRTLAWAQMLTWHKQQAVSGFRELVDIAVNDHGVNSFETAQAEVDLANAYDWFRQYDMAIRYYLSAEKKFEYDKLINLGHIQRTLYYLTGTYTNAGYYPQAIATCRKRIALADLAIEYQQMQKIRTLKTEIHICTKQGDSAHRRSSCQEFLQYTERFTVPTAFSHLNKVPAVPSCREEVSYLREEVQQIVNDGK